MFEKTYCIIGAGPSGLTSAKNLKELGIPCQVLERASEAGGNWWIDHPYSAVCHSTHLISSKKMSHFRDFPFPENYPDYPRHDQMCAYFRSYAQKFGLYDLIQFNTEVVQMERTPDGLWDVTLSTGETRRYRGVILANGHLWDPQYPEYQGTFEGIVLHSKDYKRPNVLRDKRILVVGAGNSGCDIAVEGAMHGAKTFHSTRRGYHYIPKYLFGKPTDEFGELGYKLRLPLRVRQWLNEAMLRLYWGDVTRFGLKRPDHRILETHPVANSQLIYHVGHGDIIPKPEVKALKAHSVVFTDGTEEAIDVIVYATGFKITFPFLDQKHLNWSGFGPSLYLHCFHREYDNLFLVGLLQPDSGIFHLMDGQAQLIAHFIRAQDQKPAQAQQFHQIKAKDNPDLRGGIKHKESSRHFLEIEHYSYYKRLQKLTRQLA